MKKLIISGLLAAFFGFFMILGGLYAYAWNKYREEREQPIAYSHKIHANKLNLPCTHCHIYAGQSRHAGLPTVEICMQCHKAVKADSPEIKKIHECWNNNRPINWSQVHHVRDFIGFTHKRHIKAGLDCGECHGKVQWMDAARKISSLKMGWCIYCHKNKNASRDCWTCHK